MKRYRKNIATLLAAVLIALAMASTTFAAGLVEDGNWKKDGDGRWSYYDDDGEMVSGAWIKYGRTLYYLDDEGYLAINTMVDDTYYVDETGVQVQNRWVALPDDDAESFSGSSYYYFDNKGKCVKGKKYIIGGKDYIFDEEGRMRSGWYIDEEKESLYYLGGEDEGWVHTGWQYLEPHEDMIPPDDVEYDEKEWFWFGENGKAAKDTTKYIEGKKCTFDINGIMLDGWVKKDSDIEDDLCATPSDADAEEDEDYLYYEEDTGGRADGWHYLHAPGDVEQNGDQYWFYFNEGKAKKANKDYDYAGVDDDDDKPVYRTKIKIKKSGNKYFCFDEVGRMQTGLQYIGSEDGFFSFDESGKMQTGKVMNLEDDEDVYTFYFSTKSGGNGMGWTGEKNGYVYFMGKRMEAEDNYRLYLVDGKIYLVNSSGKIQDSRKKQYNVIEEVGSGVDCEFRDDTTVKSVTIHKTTYPFPDRIRNSTDFDAVPVHVTIPSIHLYDNVYTYYFDSNGELARGWYFGDEDE